eukprot:Opistho-2@80856
MIRSLIFGRKHYLSRAVLLPNCHTVLPCSARIPRGFSTMAPAQAGKTLIKIDVTSDNICPWCFVGKRRLEEAMKKTSDAFDFEVTWHPFFLRRDLPKEGMAIADYIEMVYGRKMDVTSPSNPLNQAGREVGINFNSTRRMVPTLDSHRLVEFARTKGKQDACIEAVFRAYFENAVDISNHDNLVGIARSIGLDEAETRTFLASGNETAAIDAKDRENKMRRISGVPHFVIRKDGAQRGVQLSGAQEPDTFVDAFEEPV